MTRLTAHQRIVLQAYADQGLSRRHTAMAKLKRGPLTEAQIMAARDNLSNRGLLRLTRHDEIPARRIIITPEGLQALAR